MKSQKNFRHQDRLRMLLDLGLGKASDQTVAERAKLPRSLVARIRAEAGIPSANRIQWTTELIQQLGVRSDGAIARELGVSTRSIFKMRQKLGIAATSERGGATWIEWPDCTDELLSSISISRAAALLQVSETSVIQKRRQIRLQQFARKQS